MTEDQRFAASFFDTMAQSRALRPFQHVYRADSALTGGGRGRQQTEARYRELVIDVETPETQPINTAEPEKLGRFIGMRAARDLADILLGRDNDMLKRELARYDSSDGEPSPESTFPNVNLLRAGRRKPHRQMNDSIVVICGITRRRNHKADRNIVLHSVTFGLQLIAAVD